VTATIERCGRRGLKALKKEGRKERGNKNIFQLSGIVLSYGLDDQGFESW
jgi:hypothetical protein